jgi:hypothetical protein
MQVVDVLQKSHSPEPLISCIFRAPPSSSNLNSDQLVKLTVAPKNRSLGVRG